MQLDVCRAPTCGEWGKSRSQIVVAPLCATRDTVWFGCRSRSSLQPSDRTIVQWANLGDAERLHGFELLNADAGHAFARAASLRRSLR
jgi:hypothetical protein